MGGVAAPEAAPAGLCSGLWLFGTGALGPHHPKTESRCPRISSIKNECRAIMSVVTVAMMRPECSQNAGQVSLACNTASCRVEAASSAHCPIVPGTPDATARPEGPLGRRALQVAGGRWQAT